MKIKNREERVNSCLLMSMRVLGEGSGWVTLRQGAWQFESSTWLESERRGCRRKRCFSGHAHCRCCQPLPPRWHPASGCSEGKTTSPSGTLIAAVCVCVCVCVCVEGFQKKSRFDQVSKPHDNQNMHKYFCNLHTSLII